MQYHELRVLVPAEGPQCDISGVEAAHMIHDAITTAVCDQLGDETAPVVVVWESVRVVAASGAL